MAYDLYLTGSLHPPRTLYPPFPVLSCLCKQCRRDLQAQSHKNRWRGSCLCVLSLLQRLYLKQERNRRASCLGAGTVFCKSWTAAKLLENSRKCTLICHWGKTARLGHCRCMSRGIMSWPLEFKLLPSKSHFLWNPLNFFRCFPPHTCSFPNFHFEICALHVVAIRQRQRNISSVCRASIRHESTGVLFRL